MKTKEKILAKSLQLLNQQGVKSLTIRHIAKELNISHGNLGYHYSNLNLIITDLYMQLVKEMDEEINKLKKDKIDLKLIYLTNMVAFNTFYKYRFLFLDFVEITRSVSAIKKHYLDLVTKREKEFLFVLKKLQAEKIIGSKFSDEQFSQFVKAQFILADFWLSNSEIVYKGKESDKPLFYLNMFFAQIAPYLTEKGLKEYSALQQKTKQD